MTVTANAAVAGGEEWAEIVEVAAASGVTDLEAVVAVCREAKARQLSIVEALLETGIVDEGAFLLELADRLGWPWWAEALSPIPTAIRERVPVGLAVQHRLFPVQEEGKPLRLLTFDPFNSTARQFIAQALGERVTWALCTRKKIQDGLREGYGVGAEVFDLLMEGHDVDEALTNLRQETTVLDDEDPEASVARFVNHIFRQALQERATDIHVEPLEDELRIRYRVDGVLHAVPIPTQIRSKRSFQEPILARFKILAQLKTEERRMPQDGRINLKLEGRPIDVRVVTVPTVTGESVILRLLGQEQFDFARLNLDADHEALIVEELAKPNGIIVVTGPTGSGKSTTLYTCLTHLNQESDKIVTVEDPVEHKIKGVQQIAVQSDIGLTFATGLKTILRMDPDIVMVGEMRDVETTKIAISASQTGHLVLSTLHTNDSVAGITRLVDMGVEPFLVASSVNVFVAQRLVRRLCPRCKRKADIPEERLREIGFPAEHAGKIHEAVGCDACKEGYKGRMVIMEICRVTQAMQKLIIQREAQHVLRDQAARDGMVSLRDYGWRQVIAGHTTIEQVIQETLNRKSDEA